MQKRKPVTIADLINLEGILTFDDKKIKRFHKLYHWPDWVPEEYLTFNFQVIDMASAKKPFKCSDTFKIQAGYPHEVIAEQKANLSNKGLKRDSLSKQKEVCIPKLTLDTFQSLIKEDTNPIVFTTPLNSNYIRDVTIVDEKSHNDLAFVYVVNRRAQIITAWSEKKVNGKFKLKKPRSIFKEASYERE